MEKLQSLVDADLLRPITDPDEPEWIAPGNESEPRPRDGYVVSFIVFVGVSYKHRQVNL